MELNGQQYIIGHKQKHIQRKSVIEVNKVKSLKLVQMITIDLIRYVDYNFKFNLKRMLSQPQQNWDQTLTELDQSSSL